MQYKQKSFFVATLTLILGGIVSISPVMTTQSQAAEVLLAQASNTKLRELLQQGRRLVDSGDYSGAVAAPGTPNPPAAPNPLTTAPIRLPFDNW